MSVTFLLCLNVIKDLQGLVQQPWKIKAMMHFENRHMKSWAWALMFFCFCFVLFLNPNYLVTE